MSSVEPHVHEAILAALAAIEAEAGMRVLFAVEAGSRAWGFPSPDSDYDVRFVYVHPPDWYLRVLPGEDHLARMLPGDLDLAGWELRKTLQLFAQSNAVLFEQLGSELVYRQRGELRERLLALLPAFFNPIAVGHHYLGLARRMHAGHLGGERVNLKKLFYVLRPLAACRWIERHDSMPPTGFDAVLRGIDLTPQQRSWIDELAAQKAAAGEGDAVPLPAPVRAWIDGWLQHAAAQVPGLPRRSGDVQQLDRLLADSVRGHEL